MLTSQAASTTVAEPVNLSVLHRPTGTPSKVSISGENRQGGRYRVVVHGLVHFCRKLASTLQSDSWQVLDRSGHGTGEMFELLRDLARCDLAYTWGGRISMGKFLWAARLLRKKKLVMLWSGSDVLFAQNEFAAGVQEPWIANKVHWAVSPWVAEEVRGLGLPCEHVQTYIVRPSPDPKPLPKQFSVLLYVADVAKADLYGWSSMLEVAQKLPRVHFNLCGLPPGQNFPVPPNVTIHHWMKDLTPLLDRSTVYYRPVRHDGLSYTVLESLAQGRHVLYSYPLTGCIQTANSETACREIETLLAAHEAGLLTLNHAGKQYVSDFYSPEVVRAGIFRRWEEIILS